MKCVVATHNRDKLKEIQAIFADLPLELIALEGFPGVEPVAETGTTLRANALIKAHAIHRATGLPVIADDTGLEVDALDGSPGIYAGRFAGPRATYRQNMEKLLTAMEHVPDSQRTARFRTCAAYADGTQELVAEGVVEGFIAREPKGHNGFGYDPVFRMCGTERTFAQMTDIQKNQISHRAKAFRALHHRITQSITVNESKETPA